MVTPTDLLAPEGPVEEELFPGEGDGAAGTELHGRLTTYINRAEAKVAGIDFPDTDHAVSLWALHLTFTAAYNVAIARPANENTMVEIIGSQGFAKDQRDAIKALAHQYAQDYRALAASVPSTAQPLGIPSRQVETKFDY